MLFFLLFIVLMPALTYADYRLYGKKMEETLAAQPDYDQNRENYDALLKKLVQRQKKNRYPRLRRAVHCGLHLGRLYLHRRRHYVTVNNIWGYHIFPFLAKSLPSRGLFVHFLGRFCNSHRFARISPPGRKIPPKRGYYGG